MAVAVHTKVYAEPKSLKELNPRLPEEIEAFFRDYNLLEDKEFALRPKTILRAAQPPSFVTAIGERPIWAAKDPESSALAGPEVRRHPRRLCRKPRQATVGGSTGLRRQRRTGPGRSRLRIRYTTTMEWGRIGLHSLLLNPTSAGFFAARLAP